MEKVTIAYYGGFITSLIGLPQNIQKKVETFYYKFLDNPHSPGINYEKINGAKDKNFHSVRIDKAYRGIVYWNKESGIYSLLWVDHHDEAYEWAIRKGSVFNREIGCLQIFDNPDLSDEPQNVSKLFAKYTNAQLLKIGVPEKQLAYVKSLSELTDFRNSKDSIPIDAYENLEYLLDDIPYDEVLDSIKSCPVSDTTDDVEILKTDRSKRTFHIIDSAEELRQIMSEPLEKWRIFLHPAQRELVERNYSGSYRITGGAGTGKTVVAMHRAKWLASQLGKGEKILFTTYTSNLTSNIKENLRKICTSEELRKIDVTTLDSWVNEFLTKTGTGKYIEYTDNIIKSLWKKAITNADVDLDLPESFYSDEWSEVITVQGAFTIEEYMVASREGRGIALNSRKKKMQVWKVIEEYIKIMQGRKGRDIDTAMYECRAALLENPSKLFKSVIVDEGQDFSSNAYMLLRAIASDEHQNDMFIVGDSHQRIYDKKAVLSRCGINIRGRSSILRINYRTTEETRKYAFAILKDIEFDNLDGEYETDYYCRSLTHGDYPKVENFNTFDAEIKYIINEINELADGGVELKDICVVARTHSLVKKYKERLINSGVKTYEISNLKHDDRSISGIRIATMHRVKGIEFPYIFVVSANKGIIPPKRALTDNNQDSITAEKCLLYVAITRAQKAAYITSHGQKSEFLV